MQYTVLVTAEKEAAYITKWGIYFEKTFSTEANLWSDTETTNNSTDSVFQVLVDPYDDILKWTFFQLGGG